MLGFNISYIDCVIEDVQELIPVEGATAYEEILFELVNKHEDKIQEQIDIYYGQLLQLKEQFEQKKLDNA
jgi:hypothetical protein